MDAVSILKEISNYCSERECDKCEIHHWCMTVLDEKEAPCNWFKEGE